MRGARPAMSQWCTTCYVELFSSIHGSNRTSMLTTPVNRILVIGGSAGSLDPIDALIGQLPTNLTATIFIVQHMSPDNTGEALLDRLSKYRAFEAKLADDGEVFK